MKEIIIKNGNITCIIPVETNDDIIKYKKGIIKAIESNGVLNSEGPTRSYTYPYLFLANSVIEYPKFD